ncbi:hypothetical protein PILCRDRAFT_94070, partial [Piloderma croceum F 1598]
IVQLRTDKKALQARCEKEADAAKQLLQEKHTLQKAMGELLPREDILDEYQRSVQNARALVADYSDGSVRSSDVGLPGSPSRKLRESMRLACNDERQSWGTLLGDRPFAQPIKHEAFLGLCLSRGKE